MEMLWPVHDVSAPLETRSTTLRIGHGLEILRGLISQGRVWPSPFNLQDKPCSSKNAQSRQLPQHSEKNGLEPGHSLF